MLRKLISLTFGIASLALLACGDGSSHYPENDGIPNNCEYADAEFYRPNIFARFDNNYRRITLVDWNTGEVVDELATDTDAANVSVLSWSPNCRYLSVRQDGNAVFYDVTNGSQVASFPGVRPFNRRHTNITWDSTSTFVTVESERDTVLKNINTGTQFTLAHHYFSIQYWSVPYGRLYAFHGDTLLAYDLNTGAVIADYSHLMHYHYTRIAFSPDHSLVAFYYASAEHDRITILNQNTMSTFEVNTGFYSVPHIAFSADNRYMALAGFTLSVWDLQNLPDADTHAPLYQYTNVPARYIDGLRFVDGTTIEVENDGYFFNWNFVTGEVVE